MGTINQKNIERNFYRNFNYMKFFFSMFKVNLVHSGCESEWEADLPYRSKGILYNKYVTIGKNNQASDSHSGTRLSENIITSLFLYKV